MFRASGHYAYAALAISPFSGFINGKSMVIALWAFV